MWIGGTGRVKEVGSDSLEIMTPLVGTKQGIFDLHDDRHYLGDRPINHLARSDEGWWAVDDHGGVWKEGDLVTEAEDATFNCILAAPHGIWLGADSARLYRLGQGGLAEDTAFAEAPGRDTWHTPWGGPPDVRSLAYGPDGILYVNVHVGGILHYDDSGPSPTLDIDADVHQVIAHPERPSTVLAATAWGLGVSTNGHDFDFRTDGLNHSYCRAVAVSGDTILVSAAQGPSGGDSALYLGDMSGGPLRRCEHGLPGSFEGNLDTHCLASTDDGFWAVNGSTAWRTDDKGITWQAVRSDLPPVTCVVA